MIERAGTDDRVVVAEMLDVLVLGSECESSHP